MRAFSKRAGHRIAALAAAVASVGLAGWGALPASGAVLIDLRAVGVNGQPVFGDKNAGFLNIGDTLTLNVVARISGTNAVQTIGNFDGVPPATDTRNDDSFRALVGSFNSVGSAKGDFLGGANANQGAGNLVQPWAALGSSNGTARDFDSDGDLDLGGAGTDPTYQWAAYASAPQFPTVANRGAPVQTRFGVSSPFVEDVGGPNSGVKGTKIVDTTTAECLLGELTFIVTGGSGSASINFVPNANGSAAALWFEDGSTTARNPANSPFGIGAPVTLSTEYVPRVLVWNPAGAGGNTWNTTNSNWLAGANTTHFNSSDAANFTDAGVGTVVLDASGIFTTWVHISNNSGTYIFTGGPIRGHDVSINGTGTTIFTVANTYVDGTTIAGGGTLIVDGGDNRLGGQISGFINIFFDNGTLRTETTGIVSNRNINIRAGGGVFDTNGLDSSLSGAISGSGAFTKRGAGTLTLTGTNANIGPKVIEAGTLKIGDGGTAGSITGNVTNDGNLTFDRSNNLTYSGQIAGSGSFTKMGTGVLTLSGVSSYSGAATVSAGTLQIANSVASRIGALSIAGGAKVDLRDNKLIMASTPVGTWDGSAYTDITGLIQSGRNGDAAPLWDGSGGIVTTQSNAAGGNLTSIGVARGDEVKPASATATDLWASQTITGTDTLVMYTYGGDANLDGKINIDDYVKIDVGSVLGLSGWSNGDFNYDGKINIDDYTTVIDANIGNQNGVFPTTSGGPASAGLLTAIPEPMSISLLFPAALLPVIGRRRRVVG
jgi:autotransporter-associated beta strand protein